MTDPTPGYASWLARNAYLAGQPAGDSALLATAWPYLDPEQRDAEEAGAKAAADATPVSARLSLARCAQHQGEIHAQILDEAIAGLNVWACLRALADVAEAKAAGNTVQPAQEAAAPGETASAPEPAKDDPFGGHEFHYEPHTDLFRCVRCHRYEVSARKGDGPGEFEPCTGTAPDDSEIEVNAW